VPIPFSSKHAHNGLDVISHRVEIVPTVRRNGAAPATLIKRDCKRLAAEPTYDLLIRRTDLRAPRTSHLPLRRPPKRTKRC
jgi:hypothetical protein